MTEIDQLVKMIVDVTLNDYESYENILKEVEIWAVEDNVAHSNELIVEALFQALQKNYIKSFNYSEQQQEFVATEVSTKELTSLYFFATTVGQKILSQQ